MGYRLDTLPGFMAPGVPTGSFWFGPGNGTTSNQAPTINQMRVAPIFVPNASVAINAIGCQITSSGAAGSLIRLGIYRSDVNNLPGDLLVDAGTIDGTQAPNFYSIAITQTLTRGVWWVCFVNQVATATVVCMAGIGYNMAMANGGQTSTTVNGYTNGASTTGGLPSTFGAITATAQAPRVLVRAT